MKKNITLIHDCNNGNTEMMYLNNKLVKNGSILSLLESLGYKIEHYNIPWFRPTENSNAHIEYPKVLPDKLNFDVFLKY